MDNTILQMEGIRKSFGKVEVLHNINFQVERGKVTALVGENGAGKSTLMKIMMGEYQPDGSGWRGSSLPKPDTRIGSWHFHDFSGNVPLPGYDSGTKPVSGQRTQKVVLCQQQGTKQNGQRAA